MKKNGAVGADKLTRIAIVSGERCRPKKCNLECKKNCPVVRQGKLCIEVKSDSKVSFISETLCIGCGICIKKCPLDAIKILNLPSSLEKDTTHRFGSNSFKLHRLPTPRIGEVLGLVGTNGIGKSTALKILSSKIKLNLGRFSNPPDWQEILTFFRGSELQNYFTKLLEDKISSIVKPQYIDQIPKLIKGSVIGFLKKKDQMNKLDQVIEDYGITTKYNLELTKILDRDIEQLSGEICVRNNLLANQRYIVVEHDLSVLDYLSDHICVLYGVPSAYGVVTLPFTVKEGINIFLDGFVPTENLRFRETSLTFKFMETVDTSSKGGTNSYSYPAMVKKFDNFELEVVSGEFNSSQIVVMLGENGTGKTTFIQMLSEHFNPPQETNNRMTVSYKPQKISPRSEHTVKTMLFTKINDSMNNSQFQTDIVKPLQLEEIFDQNVCIFVDKKVKNLSGGELQRVALALCLGKTADIYLLDEPSAYLDSEQRINSARVIKRFIFHSKKTAFIVEHDFIMATYLADRIIVFGGTPSIKTRAERPQSIINGVNMFLKQMQISFRRDSKNYRPRINKHGSVKVSTDIEQKRAGNYFFTED
ncbi:hypothetical protein MXB_3642 [Myxobolus squamalis]|nr:hypothetical protein MXB_3642 [Myxobolus squamalis]